MTHYKMILVHSIKKMGLMDHRYQQKKCQDLDPKNYDLKDRRSSEGRISTIQNIKR